jgi:carboxypeptidase D
MRILARIAVGVLLLNFGFPANGQDVADIALLRKRVSELGQAEVTVRYTGYNEASALSREFSVDRYNEGRLHIVLSHATIDRFIGLYLPFSLVAPPDSKGLETAGPETKATDWQSYPTYSQYEIIMKQFALDYPALCRLDTIGTSINGKLVLVLKISDNVTFDEPDEPEVFYSSTMHGDELAGFVLMMRLADHLLSNYATDAGVKSLVDNLQIYINPLANPDGTYRTGDVISSPSRFNANGKDLNRNFPRSVSTIGCSGEREC